MQVPKAFNGAAAAMCECTDVAVLSFSYVCVRTALINYHPGVLFPGMFTNLAKTRGALFF